MNALTTPERGALALSETELLDVLSSSLYPGAADNSIKMVIAYCRAANLDVMQKPVHIVPMWDSKASRMRDVILPGISLYRIQASRSGHAGTSKPNFGPLVTEIIGGEEVTYPEWCEITVLRRQPGGQVDAFTAIEYWRENYAMKGGRDKSIAPNSMWARRTRGQIAKCAEAQALRKAFPEIGSQPTAEEMEGREHYEESAPRHMGSVDEVKPALPAALPNCADDTFAKNLPAWLDVIDKGRKTPGEIIAMAQTKYVLSDEQQRRIRRESVIDAETGEVTNTHDHDDSVADMEAAEAQQ